MRRSTHPGTRDKSSRRARSSVGYATGRRRGNFREVERRACSRTAAMQACRCASLDEHVGLEFAALGKIPGTPFPSRSAISLHASFSSFFLLFLVELVQVSFELPS